MKEAKEIASAVVGPPTSALDVAKVNAAVVVVDDINLKVAKVICGVVCEIQEGFVVVMCC